VSSLAIPPISDSLPPQALAYTNLMGQLVQAINSGDLSSIQSLYNKLVDLALPSPAANSGLSTLVNQVGAALKAGSVAEAQSALGAYTSARQTAPAVPAAPAAPAATVTRAADATIASGLLSGLQGGVGGAETRAALLGSLSGVSAAGSGSSSSLGSLLSFLGAGVAATPVPVANSAPTSPAGVSSIDSLVTTIQSNLISLTPSMPGVLANLSTTGNFVDTSA